MYKPETITQNPSLLYQKTQEYLNCRRINQTILLSTEDYNTLYPVVANELYQSLTLLSKPIHITEEAEGLVLDGFILYGEHMKMLEFLFTYQGEWLLNRKPLTLPEELERNIAKYICNLMEGGELIMVNAERLEMEIEGIEIPERELRVYLKENGLNPTDEYDASSATNKKAIYKSALSILNSIANNPNNLKNYKQDDMSVMDFAKNLQNRINQLERQTNQIIEDAHAGNYFNLFM